MWKYVHHFQKLSPSLEVYRTHCNTLIESMDVQEHRNFSLWEELKKQINKSVEVVFIISAATILDPRFKKLPFSDVSNIKAIEERLLNILRSKYSTNGLEPSLAPTEVSASESQSTIKVGKKIAVEKF